MACNQHYNCYRLVKNIRYSGVGPLVSTSGVTGRGAGGRVPPETSDREIFADLTGKKRGKDNGKGENEEEKKENCKREGGKIENGWREKFENEERIFFFFFFFFHFSKRRKLLLGLPKWKFSTGKKHFTPGKKPRKMTLPPPEKISCYTPGLYL